MNVKILRVKDKTLIDAQIVDSKPIKIVLPSFSDGWRFDFNKHSKKKGFTTYVLVCEETPDKIEGCLVFVMRENVEPYMAFIEVAPHNIGKTKEYDKVVGAGCLIGFACQLSFIYGKGDFQGYLSFDVSEEDKDDEIKLMAMYSAKYNAFKVGETMMIIPPLAGKKLIDEFLK